MTTPDQALDATTDVLVTHFPLKVIAEHLSEGQYSYMDSGLRIDCNAELERVSGEAHEAADKCAAAGFPELAGKLMLLDGLLRKVALSNHKEVIAAYRAADEAWKNAAAELEAAEMAVVL